jgi:uncharacterized protein (TIRG00374 family)
MAWLRAHKTLVGFLVGVPVSVFFLWLASRNADLSAVRRSLEDARLGLVAIAVLAMLGVYAVQAARWRTIARAQHVGLLRVYELVVSGIACNNVLPGRVGDLLRARWLGREGRFPAGRALGTVVLDRGCDVVALFVFLAIGLVVVTSAGWLVRIAVGGAFVLLGLAATLAFSRLYTSRRARARRERGLLRRVVRDAMEMLAEPVGRRQLAVWIGLSLGAWALWAVGAILVGRSLDIELSVVEALFVAGVMNLGVAIPSSPGFVGTYQWLGVTSLGVLGVGADDALAFSIVLHASWYVPTTLLGAGALGLRALASRRRAQAADETATPVD